MDKSRLIVLIIAYYFPPSGEIGALRPSRFYKFLRRMGYDCRVLTATPQNEECPNVTVVRDELEGVWDSPPGTRLPAKAYVELLFRKAMFPGHIGFVWSWAVAAECQRMVRNHPDKQVVVVSTYPPIGTLLAGLLIRLRQNVRWISDFRDPIGGVPLELLPQRVRFWTRRFEALTFRIADAVVANVEAAAAVWRQSYPAAQGKLRVLYNGFDPDDVPRPRDIPARDRRSIVHAGTLYHGRNPNVVLEAFARLHKRGIAETASVGLLFLGDVDFRAGLNREIADDGQREGWLEFRGIVPRGEALRIVEEADGLLLVQPQTNIQVPGKLFEYICIGRAILAIIPRSSPIEDILRKSGAAHVCIYPGDPAEVADEKLLTFLRFPNTSTPMNEWFQTSFNSRNQTETLAQIIDEVAETGD
jgi:glycosyltransferase involved in cell wall biosynthesis